MPTVLWFPVWIATFSLVPTPSVLLTSTGRRNGPAAVRSYRPPNDPISVRTPFLKVPRAISRMRWMARILASMSTPASLYVSPPDGASLPWMSPGVVTGRAARSRPLPFAFPGMDTPRPVDMLRGPHVFWVANYIAGGGAGVNGHHEEAGRS